MKEIIFKESNFEKIQNELDSVQERCTVRTVTINDIKNAFKDITEFLNIAKKHMDGITVWIDVNAQDFPGAYKYNPVSTQVKAWYHNGSWRILDIDRLTTEKASRKYIVTHTQESKKAILDRFMHFS